MEGQRPRTSEKQTHCPGRNKKTQEYMKEMPSTDVILTECPKQQKPNEGEEKEEEQSEKDNSLNGM